MYCSLFFASDSVHPFGRLFLFSHLAAVAGFPRSSPAPVPTVRQGVIRYFFQFCTSLPANSPLKFSVSMSSVHFLSIFPVLFSSEVAAAHGGVLLLQQLLQTARLLSVMLLSIESSCVSSASGASARSLRFPRSCL